MSMQWFRVPKDIVFGEGALGVENLSEAIKELNSKLGIPLSFKDVDEVDIPEKEFVEALGRMSKNAFEDPCTLTNPKQTCGEDRALIYKATYYGQDIK